MKRITFCLIIFAALVTTGCRVDFFADKNTAVQAGKTNGEGVTTKGAAAPEENYHYAYSWDRQAYESYFTLARDTGIGEDIRGGIVPHHLLAGYIPATFFRALAPQKPSLVVVFGPNHRNMGAEIITSERDWQTPYGVARVDKKLARSLANSGVAVIDEETMKDEYAIGALTPFVAAAIPNAKILPVVFHFQTPTATVEALVEKLRNELPSDAVFVASVDFSHYMTASVAEFHDALARAAVRNFDYNRLDILDIDSPSSLYAFLRLLESAGAKKIAYETSDNSARLSGQLDLPETTSYYAPIFVKSEEPASKTPIASLLFFGDMMLDRNVKKQIDAHTPDWIFEKLAGQDKRFFLGMDAVAANLEGPFADKRRPTTKEIAFCFDPALLSTLAKYRFSIFSQANNHSYDMGKDAFAESKKNILAAGMDYYGAQYSVGDESVLLKKAGDWRVAFVGINDTNSPVDTAKVAALMKKAKANADFVVVNAHWGEEYKEVSNARQRKLARALVDAGADVIIGHHPHVVQELEVYSDRPIFYSLGNFVFDQYFSVPTQQGLGVGVVLGEKDGKKTVTASVFPLMGRGSQVSQMPYADGQKYLENWIAKSRLGEYNFSTMQSIILNYD